MGAPKDLAPHWLINGRRVRAAIERSRVDTPGENRLCHLDGLRAVALICVLLFHFKAPVARGGFLGVDVFFVLSGFLMTRALLIKIDNGTLSVLQFIASRIRRICPAHLTMVLLTLVGAQILMPIHLIPRISESSSFAALFLSNFKFLTENGYHDTASSLKPLLHTWSLGVEAQFYILWACLALSGTLEDVVAMMMLLCTASLLFHYFAAEYGAALFFSSWSRLYEFGAGSVALILYDSFSDRVSNILANIGGLSIVLSVAMAKPHHTPIVFVSLPIVVGTMLIVACPRGYLCKALSSSKILAYIGKISYSAYLVHWPAIVLLSSTLSSDLVAIPAAIGSTIVLSPLLYKFVEEAFQTRRARSNGGSGILFSGILVLLIISFSTVAERRAALRVQSVAEEAKELGGVALKSREEYVREQLDTRRQLFRNGSIAWHTNRPKGPHAVVVGDSFSAHLFPAIAVAGRKTNTTKDIRETYYMGANGCPPLIIVEKFSGKGNRELAKIVRRETCLRNVRNTNSVLHRSRARTIIFINRWQDYYFVESKFATPRIRRPFYVKGKPKEVFRLFSRSLKAAMKLSDHVRVIGLIPHLEKAVLNCLWKHINGTRIAEDADAACPLQFEVPQDEIEWNESFRDFVVREHPGVEYVDVLRNSRLCQKTRCTAWDKSAGPMAFDDAGHLTHEGALRAMVGVTLD